MNDTIAAKPCPLCGSTDMTHERELRGHELIKCAACSFVFANLSTAEIEAYNSSYDSDSAATYAAIQTVLDYTWFRQIAHRMTRIHGTGRVLDIGCGNGLLLKQFIELGWDCCGIDLSPWSRKFAEQYGFRLVTGSIAQADLEPHSFDLVVNTSTLEHIADPLSFVSAAASLVKPNGRLYMAGMPNYGSIAVRLGVSGFYGNAPPGHVNYFTPRTLRRLMREAGLGPSSVAVRSYGLPEAFRLYDRLRDLVRRPPAPGPHPVNSVRPVQETPPHTHPPAHMLRLRLAALATTAYYYSGRLWGLGDKLEVEVRQGMETGDSSQ